MPEKSDAKRSILFTGHLIDAAGRKEKRFRVDMMEDVRRLIRTYLEEEMRHDAPDIAITSLGAGGDMIFADEVLKMGIPLIVFLPFAKERFLEESVLFEKESTREPVNWEKEFERILGSADKVIYTGDATADENPFEKCNRSMFEYAMTEAGGDKELVTAMALMRPQEALKDGGTSHFVEELKRRRIGVHIVWPEAKEKPNEVDMLDSIIPVFRELDSSATYHQNKWKQRLITGLIILGVIVFFDEFGNIPDTMFWGYAPVVRIIAVIISMTGVFVTLQLRLSDKTSFGKWTQDRAKAEQIRSEIWFYLFNIRSENNESGCYSESEFEQYIDQLKPFVWHGYLINMSRLIGLKKRVLSYDLAGKKKYYRKYRLADQLAYFRKKRAQLRKKMFFYKTVIYLMLAVSLVWGMLNIIGEFYTMPAYIVDISLIGMLVGFIALISTYLESNNTKEMEFKYQQMQEGLETVIEKSESIRDLAHFDTYVLDSETYLRSQNKEWSLKRLKE
ncbi:SLATT domain-containing protein [Rhodohalobacter mucosus]|uniref:SMODS and SLOG-associating 2TM effector domain-containing protein n=1 Tax=Rhodohalobacter mucosus TaxID=2079485 RepID=A0A316TL66_9BACT|nr:SLATT domain-containing protein [Rhodohalobacter mucosus]PWN05110.1 hypothetical protein DDZ15_16275 [Rhodohalobacter mucosus]